MALTSNDETDLLLPLYRGIDETPQFATFLERLRRRTGAELVDLILEQDIVGRPSTRLLPQDPSTRAALRPFRTYTLEEVNRGQNEYVDARLAMFPLTDGARGWIIIARNRTCSASDSAILSSLVPYVQTVVAAGKQVEQERAASELGAKVLAKTGTGWILLDADLRVLNIEARVQHNLGVATGSIPAIGERLRGIPASAERRLAKAAERNGVSGEAVLLHEPRIDAVLERIEAGSRISRAYPGAAVIVWCRFEAPDRRERVETLACLYELPRREAELAVAIADGLSIADAGQQMGITLETARNYTKQLYAKLDVSGQAQLVRLVQRSGSMLA